MSAPTTPPRPEGLTGHLKSFRNPTRAFTMSPPRPASPTTTTSGTGGRAAPTRASVRANAPEQVAGTPKHGVDALKPETDAVKVDVDALKNAATLGHTRARSGSTISSQVPMTPQPLATITEPIEISNSDYPMSDSSHDGASIASSRSPSRLRRQVSNLSRHSVSGSIRRLSLLGPSSPPQVESTPAVAVGEMQRSVGHSASISSLRRQAESPEPASVIPETPEPQTPVNPPTSRNASTDSLTRSPTPDKPEPKRRGTLSNWARKSIDKTLERGSNVSNPPPSVIRSPSRGPAKSRGESDTESVKERERRWGHGTGLPMPKPPTLKKSEDSIKRRFSLGRRPSESGTKALRESITDSEKKPNWASKILRAGSKSKKDKADGSSTTPEASTVDVTSTQSASDPTESGADRDAEFMKERERRWGSGLSVPHPPIVKKSEGNAKHQFALSGRPSESGTVSRSASISSLRRHATGSEPVVPENPEPVDLVSPSAVVSSLLSSFEVITLLGERGCQNLSSRLSLQTCSQYPVSGGGFGDVYSGKLDDGTEVAIKTMRSYGVDGPLAGKYQKRIAKELYTWSKCNHPNVARLLGLTEFRGCLAMVSDWAENGTLLSYINNNPSANRCILSASICEGLAYLHGKNIVHGDLKGANVLVSGDGTPMLTDFGNANLDTATMIFTETATTPGHSLRWTAPEIIKYSSPSSRPGDVYALGMTILETITGQVPFSNLKDLSITRIVVDKKGTPKRPEQIPTRSICGNILWGVLLSCWAYEPRLRPSVMQVRDYIKLFTPETLEYIEPEPDSEGDSDNSDQ